MWFLVFFGLRVVEAFLTLTEKDRARGNYSTHQCIGGSQVLETQPMSWAMRQGKQLSKFPMNDPEFRTCKLRNVCLMDGQLTYYISNYTAKHVSQDYLPEGFYKGQGTMFHTGHLRGNTMPIKTVVGHAPSMHGSGQHGAASWHNPDVSVFLDAVSWSFNYGHYLIDNVLPVWFAARIFNIPFSSVQQLFETRCRQFTTLEAKFADNKVGYNHSLGTYQQACLARVEGMAHYFFNNQPLFADELAHAQSKKSVCFKTLVVGHGSTFGLKAVELSRAVLVREFRDNFLTSLMSHLQKQAVPASATATATATASTAAAAAANELLHTLNSPQEDLILVGLRTQGAAGGKIINDLCSRVKDSLSRLDEYYSSKYKVECFVPAEVSLEQEVASVRRAKILISVHGTISYFSLFSRDGTQQISIADPKEYKENQTLLWLTHTQLVYITWDKISKDLTAVLGMALARSEAHFE